MSKPLSDYEIDRFNSSRIRAKRMRSAREKGRHTNEQWLNLVAHCGMKCVRCGFFGTLVKDHILPVFAGGSDGMDNIQPLCIRCNSSKGPEFIDHRPAGWKEALS